MLPRPTLTLKDIMPPQRIPLQELLSVSLEKTRQRDGLPIESSPNASKLREVRQSALKYFATPMDASRSERNAWTMLSQTDWDQVLAEAQALSSARSSPSGDPMLQSWVPRILAVTELLDDLKSNSYAEFAWSKLLTPLLAQCVSANGGLTQASTLFAALLRHSFITELSPSNFRALLRARNLRQVDAVFGAQAELKLLQLFHEQRRTPNRNPNDC